MNWHQKRCKSHKVVYPLGLADNRVHGFELRPEENRVIISVCPGALRSDIVSVCSLAFTASSLIRAETISPY